MTDVIRVAVVGCTGSVGSSVIDVCRRYRDRFDVVGIAARGDADGLRRLALEFMPSKVVLREKKDLGDMDLPLGIKKLSGDDGLLDMVCSDDVDHVAFVSSGTEAIPSLLAALKAGKTVSLANKESIVVSGRWVLPHSAKGQIRPLDSEHNAIWQCLFGEDIDNVDQIGLTASGGPFRLTPLDELGSVTPEMAVNHPVWSMGQKISVDSATMINKGIEIIEAMRLFSLPSKKVTSYIHPGSSVHGFVRFVDSSVKMLMAPPDMRLSALSALSYPRRLPVAPLSLKPIPIDGLSMSFSEPDRDRYPGYYLALEVAEAGGSYPTVLVGADEVAVKAFLEKKIGFTDIPRVISEVIGRFDGHPACSLEDELDILSWSRTAADSVCMGRR